MALGTFNLKSKDTTHPVYTVMLSQTVADDYISASFVEAKPESTSKKAVSYKTVLGYTMRNAGVDFTAHNAESIDQVVVDFAIVSKTDYVANPSYVFNSDGQNTWNPTLTKVREEKIGNRYTTYYRLTMINPNSDYCKHCSIRFQNNGVFIYDIQLQYMYNVQP